MSNLSSTEIELCEHVNACGSCDRCCDGQCSDNESEQG